MAVQYDTTLRNTWLDAITARYGNTPDIEIWSGGIPANAAAASTGTKLAKFDVVGNVGVYDDAAAAGSKNILAAAGLPLAATGGGLADGTAGYYRVFTSGGTCIEQGTVTEAGGGGDMIIDSVTIGSGQTVNITAFTKTAPGA